MLATLPAEIVLARSIGGVSLGTRRAVLTGRFGKGVVTMSGKGSYGPYAVVAYARPKLSVTYVKGTATTVATRSKSYRTANGIVIGTAKARLLSAYGKRIACGNFEVCTVGAALPGRAVTTFELHAGRVSEIDVSSVLN
ncbi:MAG: hypothetical protein ABI317_13710 [Gaiellales bacterium]